MSSNIMPSTMSRILRSSAGKAKQDAPPANAGKHAAPVAPGHGDDLVRDVLPTSQGRYAVPATTGCDDKSSARKPF